MSRVILPTLIFDAVFPAICAPKLCPIKCTFDKGNPCDTKYSINFAVYLPIATQFATAVTYHGPPTRNLALTRIILYSSGRCKYAKTPCICSVELNVYSKTALPFFISILSLVCELSKKPWKKKTVGKSGLNPDAFSNSSLLICRADGSNGLFLKRFSFSSNYGGFH